MEAVEFKHCKKVVKMWTPEEDEELKQAVRKYGKNDWNRVAECVPTRTRKQCRERYVHHLDESIVKSKWTEEEDKIIMRLQSQIGNKWCEISEHLVGRAPNSIKNRYFSYLKRHYIEESDASDDKVVVRSCFSPVNKCFFEVINN